MTILEFFHVDDHIDFLVIDREEVLGIYYGCHADGVRNDTLELLQNFLQY